MDVSPDVNLLRSMRGERVDHVVLAGEGVDNAFDASASHVTITIGDDEILFEDDGCGIDRSNIAKLFSLGGHGELKTTKLGRFGIGITSHAVRNGNILEVDTTSNDGRIRARCDWRDILRTRRWHVPDERWVPVTVGARTGTSVSIQALLSQPKLALDKIIDELALRFYPAIADGRRITINRVPVPLFADPTMTDVIETEITLSEGRSAQIRAGILAQPSKLNRVHVSYEHRVIMPASTVGTGEYSGLTKMFARLRLMGKNWHLSRYKDDLSNEDERAELEDAVLEAIRPILEKCQSATMQGRIDQIADLVNDMVPPDIAAARPRRQGTAALEQQKKQRTKANGNVLPEKAMPDGPARTRRPPHDRLLITFDGHNEDQGVGEFQPGRPNRVDLSPDNPYVAELVAHRDMQLGARAIYALAIVLFEQGREQHKGQFNLFSFGRRVAQLLDLQDKVA